MGAAFSGSSLCRFVGGVEILTSSVIIGFGTLSLAKFYGIEDQGFQTVYNRIPYSAFTAIAHGILTILAALFLIIGSQQTKEQPVPDSCDNEKNEETFKSNLVKNSNRRVSRVFKSWLIFSVFSICLLLFTFIFSMNYCLENEMERTNTISREQHNLVSSSDNDSDESKGSSGWKRSFPSGIQSNIKPPCYTESEEIHGLRQSLRDLYSYCLVNVFALLCFMFVIYYQLKGVVSDKIDSRADQEVCIPPVASEENGNT